jgi:hypothetical protein
MRRIDVGRALAARAFAVVSLAALALLAPALALGADPSPSAAPRSTLPPAFDGVPTPAAVLAAFANGSDTFEGAARQAAALSLVGDIAGDIDSLVTTYDGGAGLTFAGSFDAEWGSIVHRIQSGLPADQQPYVEGTRFAAWRALLDSNRADPAVQAKVMTLFSASFRAAQPSLAALLKQDGARPLTQPPLTKEQAEAASPSPARMAVNLLSQWGLVILFFLGSAIGGIAVSIGLRSRLALDAGKTFTLHKGTTEYRLTHSTGVVENASKLGTTNVYGSTGSVSSDGAGNVWSTPGYVSSSTTIHDQFFLRQTDRSLEPVQLSDWDVPLADGHVVSVVWSVADGGSSRLAAVLNHTTKHRYSKIDSAFPIGDHVASDASYILLALGCAALVFGVVTVTAAQATNGYVLYPALIPAIVVTLVAALIGRSQAKNLAWFGAMSGFKRRDLPKVYAALDRDAGQVSQA